MNAGGPGRLGQEYFFLQGQGMAGMSAGDGESGGKSQLAHSLDQVQDCSVVGEGGLQLTLHLVPGGEQPDHSAVDVDLRPPAVHLPAVEAAGDEGVEHAQAEQLAVDAPEVLPALLDGHVLDRSALWKGIRTYALLQRWLQSRFSPLAQSSAIARPAASPLVRNSLPRPPAGRR